MVRTYITSMVFTAPEVQCFGLSPPHLCSETTTRLNGAAVEGFGDRLKQMKAMQSGDFSHLLADIESSSNPQALQKLPALEDLVITPTPLDEFMDALDKCACHFVSETNEKEFMSAGRCLLMLDIYWISPSR